MPKYQLNGKTYNIPDNIVAQFESDNPSATTLFEANGHKYAIPVSKRDGFLKKFPDAKLAGESENKTFNPVQWLQKGADALKNMQAAATQQPVQQPVQQNVQQAPVEQTAATQQQPTQQVEQQVAQPKPEFFRNTMGKMRAMVNGEPYISEEEQKNFGNEIMTRMYANMSDEEFKRIKEKEANNAFEKDLAKEYDPQTIAANKKQVEAMRQRYVGEYMQEAGKQWEEMRPTLDAVREQQKQEQEQQKEQQKEFLRDNPQFDPANYADIEREFNKPLEYGETKEYRAEAKRLAKRDRFKELEKQAVEYKKLDSEIEQKRLERRLEEAENQRKANFGIGINSILPTEDENILSEAISQRKKQQQILQDEIDDAGFVKGLSNSVTDVSNWTFGLSDLRSASLLSNIKDKLDSGKELSESEEMLLDATLGRMQADEDYSKNRGTGYNVGTGVGTSLTDLPSYALGMGPMKSIAKGVLRQTSKAGLRMIGREAYRRAVPRALIKMTGVGAGTLAAGATFVNTIQLPKVIAGTMEKMNGRLTRDDDGKYAFKDGESLLPALWHTQQELIPEAASEVFGEFIPGVGGLVDKGMRKVHLTRVADGLQRLSNSKLWKGYDEMLEKVGWHGLSGEAIEEYMGDVQSAMLGDTSGILGDANGKGGWGDWEKHKQIWLTTAALGPILNAPRYVATGYQYAGHYVYQRKAENASRRAQDIFGTDAWNTLKGTIDETENRDMADLADSIVKGNFSQEQKVAALDYISKVTQQRSYNVGVIASQNTPASKENATPRTASLSFQGNTINELDEQGNVIASHTYEDNDEKQAIIQGIYDKRANADMIADYEVLRQLDDAQAQTILKDFSEQNGLTVQSLLDMMQKDPMARTDNEATMMESLAATLHEAAYPEGTSHPAQSFQDGQKEADNTPIEPATMPDGTPVETQSQQQLATLQADAQAAQQNLEAFLNAHTDIAEATNGMSPVDAIDYISNNFSGTERDEAISTYVAAINAQAKLQGYQQQLQGNIDNFVQSEVQSRTFKGTINGVAPEMSQDGDMPIYTITDGDQAYTLVSGDVGTTGAADVMGNQVIDPASSSEMILGLDSDGTFVSLHPNARMTLDQGSMQAFADNLRAQYTPQSPQEQEAQPIQSAQAGGEAGATATGANEPSAAAPSEVATESQQTGQPQQVEQPQQEAEVQEDETAGTTAAEIPVDKDGVKRYEQGVAVDDAIADMVNDELDVNEEADLAINEAQEELDKIKAPKTRAERVKNAAKRKELQQTIDYYTQVKQRWEEMNREPVDATPFIEQLNKATSKKRADEILNAALQAGVDPNEIQPVHTQKVTGLVTSEEERRNNRQKAIQRDWDKAKQKYESEGIPFNADWSTPDTVEELASMYIGGNNALAWENTSDGKRGFQEAMGAVARKIGKDTSSGKFNYLFSKAGEGIGFDELVHTIYESPENNGRWSTEDITDAILNLFRTANEGKDITDYMLRNRIAQAERLLQGKQRSADEAANMPPTEQEQQEVPDGGLPFPPMNEEEVPFGENEGQQEEETSEDNNQPQQNEREQYLATHPLTEEQIMADAEATEDEKLNAIDFLRGEDDSAISRFYYDQIYERAANTPHTRPKESKAEDAADPMAAVERAAQSFRERQKTQDQQDIDDALKEFSDFLDNAKGNSLLGKFMQKGIEGNNRAQASLLDALLLGTNAAQRAFIGDLLRLASKVGYAYIKNGVHDFQAWSKQMASTIGKKLKDVLGWDDNLVNDFIGEVWEQKYTVDGERMRLRAHAEKLKNDKGADQTVNVNKDVLQDENKDVNSQQETSETQQQTEQLEGDSAEFAERQKDTKALSLDIYEALRNAVFNGDVSLKTMQNVKALAKEHGLEDMAVTDLQELVEAEVVNLARQIGEMGNINDEQKFEYIKRLYESQPTLSARDNDRINRQQYSTPAPMAFLMGQFVMGYRNGVAAKQTKGLEPSAGNGMLTIGLPKEGMHVNDIDDMRVSNLQKQGFGEVTSQDGTLPFEPKAYDVVVTNPPFGSVTPKVYDGLYEISALEHQMAINALESMKDDGRAAIIIGGNTDYKTNGAVQGKDRVFLNYLYSHYNVVDVINMDGKTLYSKQGTGYPVRMILINGRKPFDQNSFAPVKSKARAEQVKSYDELYKRVNDDILRDTEHNGDTSTGVHPAESGQNGGLSDNGHAGTPNEKGVRGVRSGGSTGEHQLPTEPVGGVQRSGSSTETEGGRGDSQSAADGGLGEGTVLLHGRGNQPEQSGGSQAVPSGNGGGEVAVGESNAQRLPGNTVDSGAGLSVEQPEQKRELGTEKVPYRKQSKNAFDLQSQMPAEQADVVKKALEDLGDVDQFLVDELGYSSNEELYQALAAEQIDSVALAISQMKKGDAFIIGDQTGIGKGRQGAALIRWAVKNGKAPVYFTAKPELFSSVYRDIKDIHSDGLRPFILASDKVKARITERNKEGEDVVLYDLPSDKEQKRVLDYINKNGKLPPEYDFMITTYSQVGNGTMEYENGNKSARRYPKGKTATKADENGQKKRDAIENLAGSSIVIMDESHLAGGESARGNYLQYVSTKASGITYISATFAKRPDNMPLYSLRTAISKAGVAVSELIDAVKRGGATFQEIMSKALTEAGQMIRRERDMRGVTVDWRGIEDEAVIQKHYKQYDKIIGFFNDIINFQRTYIDPIINKMNDDAADMQGNVDHTPGTRDMGINNTPFASQTHNIVKQVLLALKAEEGAKFAVECLKKEEKPVICVENTNEGAADRAVGNSEDEDMVMPDLSTNLKKGLEGTLRIQTTDANNNSIQSYIPLSSLPEEAQHRYHEIEEAIENASTGLSLSPIDVIKNYIKNAGYSVAELTGRKKEFIYNPDGTVKRVNRTDTDNKKNAADFNSGKIDALIINKSAGTGIDLHAGIKFDNSDQRHMITVQAQSDINDEVQMRGRTDRTGQKQHSKYTYIVSTIPSEQRLLMMLKAKLRSLDANTTSSQKSKFNEMQVQDIINKYGDQIVVQYLAENPDTYAKLADPLKWGESVYDTPVEALIESANRPAGDGATASRVLGRMALLKVAEQEKMLDDITSLYQAEIDRLNEMGENDLEITEMPLKAKTLSKQVWEQGVDPDGKNPFADNTYVEKVQMDVLKKPMKAEEVKAAQARLLNGKSWEDFKQATMDKVNKWAEEKKAETTKTITERAEKKAKAEQERYVKGAKKAQEKTGMTDEEIEKNGQFQYDNIYKEEMEKLTPALASIEVQRQVFEQALETFSTDGVYALPSNIYDLGSMTFEPGFGKLIDVKITDNFSPNASTLTFATLDGRRKITVPINGKVKQQNNEKRDLFPVINSLTAQTRNGMFGSNVANTLRVLEQNVDNWDKLTSSAARKEGYIVTGNLLKALVSTREQHVGGKLISYTTDTGEVRQGILMPDNFEPAGLTSKTPISAKKDELKYSRDEVVSADGDVKVRVTNDWDWRDRGYNTLELTVPKSKKRGEKYFNDKVLLGLMDGQFEGSSKLKAEFPRANLDAVLKRLDELGVTVTEEQNSGLFNEFENSSNNTNRSANSEKNGLSLPTDWDILPENDVDNPYTGQTMKGLDTLLREAEDEVKRLESQGKDATVPRQEAQSIRTELDNRKRKQDDWRKKYNIKSDGSISLEDLSRIFRDHNSNKILDKLFDKVVEQAKKIGLKISFDNTLEGAGHSGYNGKVTFHLGFMTATNRTDEGIATSILHELIHSVCQSTLRAYKEGGRYAESLTRSQKQAAKEIIKIWEQIKDKDEIKNNPDEYVKYGGKNPQEMVAQMADPLFRDVLRNVMIDGRNALERLIDAIKRILGMEVHPRETPAFDALDKALDNLIDNFRRETFEATRGYSGDENWENYSPVSDRSVIAQLEREPKIKVYRAMQLIDGKLYPPMAAKQGGKWVNPIELGKWEKSDEHPEMADENGRFKLDKGNGKSLKAAYNPYIHTSTTMLNDQFSEAQNRPNLVVVEVEVPESELTSGYKAEKAKDAVGRLEWKAGVIQGQLTGTREVILSRWDKPIRIVPTEEVAKSIADQIKGKVEVMPTNVVTPQQRAELEKLGVKFVETDNRGFITEGENKGKSYSSVYGKKATKSKKRGYSEDLEAATVSQHTEQKERIAEHIDEVLDKLGTKERTTVYKSFDELPEDDKRHVEQRHREGKKVYGWFENGKVFLYLPDIDSAYKAEQTIWHETVGHVGLRELLGEEGYNKLLDNLWLHHKDPAMVAWVTEKMQQNNWNRRKAMDEWLAREAEKTVNDNSERKSLWQKLTQWLGDALRKIGYRFAPNINDTRYLFWLSENHIDPTNPLSEAKRQALLRKLDRDMVEAEMTPDEQNAGNSGYSEDLDAPSAAQARRNYERALKRLSYVWKEAHIDALQSAVELVRAMSGKKKMEDIPSFMNFILSLNQQSSKEDAMDYLFNRDYMQPVSEVIAKILPDLGKDRKEAMRELQLYMIKKHGLERNRVMFVRDWLRDARAKVDVTNQQAVDAIDQAEEQWDIYREQYYQDLQNGKIDLAQYFAALDDLIRTTFDNTYDPSEHDYSGLTEMYPVALTLGSKATYEDALAIADVMDTEDKLADPSGNNPRVDELWKRTNALSQFSLDMEYEAGLIDKKTYNHVKDMFHFYVPLRGYDETTAEDVYDYMEERNQRNFTGPTLMNARGRKSLADADIFATLGAMGSRSIRNALTNQTKQAFARFVRHYSKGDDGLVTELGFAWAEKKGVDANGNEIWEEVQPDIPEDATGDEVADILDTFEKDMRQKQANGDAQRIRKNSSIPYRFIRREDKNQHIIDVWIGGEKRQFVVNGNPRAAQAINGQLGSTRGSNILWMSSLSRFMAKLNTSYSPDFIVRNTMRDAIFAFTNTGIKESPRYVMKWAKNYVRMLGRMMCGTKIDHINLFERYRAGKLNPNNKTDMYFKEYMENGGQTGWVEMKNKEKWKKIVEEGVKARMSGKGSEYAAKVLTFIPNVIENLNERAENMARFATYMTSREMGRSIKRSVSDAKEISVNFNRKGAGKKSSGFTGTGLKENVSALRTINSQLAGWSAQNLQDYIMFYNAGIQAVNNLAKVVKAHPIKSTVAFSAFAMAGAVMPVLNAFLKALLDGDDDDDRDPYAELPEWMRRNSLCFYAGEGSFITISLPIEMRALYGIGDMAASYFSRPELRNEKHPAVDVLSQLSQIMPLDFFGEQTGNPLWALVPSGARPILEAAFNVNWQGRPIEREQSRWNKDQPRWMLAYKNTNDLYVNASKALNAATNAYSKDDLRRMGISEEDIAEADASIKGWADGKLTDPALVQHVVEGYFGGAGKTVNNFAHVFKMFEDGENWLDILKSDKTPVLRTIHFTPTEQNQNARTRNKWYYYQNETQQTKQEVKRLREAGVADPYAQIRAIGEEDSLRSMRAQQFEQAEKEYNRIKKVLDNATDLDMKKILQMQLDALMSSTVQQLDNLQE